MATTPFSSKRTRDPLPSMVLAPAAPNKDSMRDHSMVAGAGLENTVLRVLSCLLFMVLYHDTAQGLATANDIADAWEKPLTRA